MKKEFILKVVFYSTIILMMFFAINKTDKYFDARIQYEEEECNNRAYMIYKYYDDQEEGVKTKDWLSRISDCAVISAEYQSRR